MAQRLDAGGDIGAHRPAGEVALGARGVPITRALEALAAEAGFEVRIEDARSRPPVTIDMDMAPLEVVFDRLLGNRNYALLFDGDDGSLSEVILLAPSSAAPPRPVARQQPRKAQPAPLASRN